MMVLLAQSAEQTATLLKFIHGGGVIGYVIIALSVAGLAFAIALAAQVRRSRLAPSERIRELQRLVMEGDLAAALKYCKSEVNDCMALRIAVGGIDRRLRGPLGAYEARGAMEDAGEAETARLYRAIEPLAVIANVAPLLGLLGTVQGMIGAFDTVAQSALRDASYHEQLAHNIHIALITTFQGLVVAIPCVVVHSYFRSRIDATAGEIGRELEPIAQSLESSAGRVS
ncbi:MAG: MotA/TolQ/ExbB proton channel family protein [Phycisphaerales bacterium]|nr:MotA/TolQ/ExbB proton channel family protein [Phycisphaerales bacterium]